MGGAQPAVPFTFTLLGLDDSRVRRLGRLTREVTPVNTMAPVGDPGAGRATLIHMLLDYGLHGNRSARMLSRNG